jgi:hypothetical protein
VVGVVVVPLRPGVLVVAEGVRGSADRSWSTGWAGVPAVGGPDGP